MRSTASGIWSDQTASRTAVRTGSYGDRPSRGDCSPSWTRTNNPAISRCMQTPGRTA